MTSVAQTTPRRDAAGRVVRLPELVGVAAMFLLLNGVGLIAIDALVMLIGDSAFGDSSGWLVVILPGLLFFDDFRGWRSQRIRFFAGPVAAVVAVGVGLLAAGLLDSQAPIVSGAVGGLVAVLLYCPLWFVGIRWLTGDWTEAS